MTTRRRLVRFGLGLLAVDVALLAVHVARWLGASGVQARWWNAEEDASAVELFGSAQLLVAGAVLVLLSRRIRRSPVLVAIPVLLAVIIADDLGRFHENYGAWLAHRLALPPLLGEDPRNLGELIVFAAYGVPLALAIVVTFALSSHPARRIALHVAAGLALLVLSAVVYDLLAGVAESVTGMGLVGSAVRFLENAGELLSATVVLLIALHHSWRRTPAPTPAHATTTDGHANGHTDEHPDGLAEPDVR